ncbi:MAG: hypothetical protein WD069_21285 [Planctomycetales bacterium]
MRDDAANKGQAPPPRIGFAGDPHALESVLLPAFARTGAVLRCLACTGAREAIRIGRRFRVPEATTQFARLVDDPELDAIVISGVADEAAGMLLPAIRAGKRILTDSLPLSAPAGVPPVDFERCVGAAIETGALAPAFHRRYAPLVREAVDWLAGRDDRRTIELTVRRPAAAGAVAREIPHWVDLLVHLFGPRPVVGVHDASRPESLAFALRFADGSCGTVDLVAPARGDFQQERLRIVCGNHAIEVDDFRRLRPDGPRCDRRKTLRRPDRGHGALAQAFVAALRSGRPLLDSAATREVARLSRSACEALGGALKNAESGRVADRADH